MTEAGGRKLITSNRRALHDYEILETTPERANSRQAIWDAFKAA